MAPCGDESRARVVSQVGPVGPFCGVHCAFVRERAGRALLITCPIGERSDHKQGMAYASAPMRKTCERRCGVTSTQPAKAATNRLCVRQKMVTAGTSQLRLPWRWTAVVEGAQRQSAAGRASDHVEHAVARNRI